jgi:hypothetical protein
MPETSLSGGMLPPSLTLTAFPDVYEQRPRTVTVSWERLVARLSTFPVRADTDDKRRLPCWSPTTFRDDMPATAENAEQLYALVLDIDGGMDLATALERCAPYTALGHTSWSHTPGEPRFRLVLPLARPVPAARWGSVWRAAVDVLGVPVDRLCSNANRRFLLPARPSQGAAHQVEVRATDVALDLLPLLDVPAVRADTAAATSMTVQVPHHRLERAVRHRLASDPDARRRLADTLGATLRGSAGMERADGLACPGCGRASVWFLIAPERATRARCKHRNSCGWSAPVGDLAGSAAVVADDLGRAA